MASVVRAATRAVASTSIRAAIAPAFLPARRAAPSVGRRRSCRATKPSLLAAAAIRPDTSFDDDEGDEDFDPFEGWDDLPSVSPASPSSPSSDGDDREGGIASLRTFTDALRGEVRRSLVVIFFSLFPSSTDAAENFDEQKNGKKKKNR